MGTITVSLSALTLAVGALGWLTRRWSWAATTRLGLGPRTPWT